MRNSRPSPGGSARAHGDSDVDGILVQPLDAAVTVDVFTAGALAQAAVSEGAVGSLIPCGNWVTSTQSVLHYARDVSHFTLPTHPVCPRNNRQAAVLRMQQYRS